MNYYILLFIVINIAKFQFCSVSDHHAGMLEKTEYLLWHNNSKNIVSKTIRLDENYQEDVSPDALDCSTKIVNCCLICLASMPCCMCIASFFWN